MNATTFDQRASAAVAPGRSLARSMRRLAIGLVALTAAATFAASHPQPAAAAIYLDLVGCRRDTNSVVVAQSAGDFLHVKLLRWNGTAWRLHREKTGVNSVAWHGLRNGYYAVRAWVSNDLNLWYRAYPRNYQIFNGSTLQPSRIHSNYCWV